MKAFFQKNWKKQLFIDFFTRLTNFKWLWKVNSQAFSNQTFFSILMGFQLIKISWKTCACCWHLVLAARNVIFLANSCHFDNFPATFFRVSRIQNNIEHEFNNWFGPLQYYVDNINSPTMSQICLHTICLTVIIDFSRSLKSSFKVDVLIIFNTF